MVTDISQLSIFPPGEAAVGGRENLFFHLPSFIIKNLKEKRGMLRGRMVPPAKAAGKMRGMTGGVQII